MTLGVGGVSEGHDRGAGRGCLGHSECPVLSKRQQEVANRKEGTSIEIK